MCPPCLCHSCWDDPHVHNNLWTFPCRDISCETWTRMNEHGCYSSRHAIEVHCYLIPKRVVPMLIFTHGYCQMWIKLLHNWCCNSSVKFCIFLGFSVGPRVTASAKWVTRHCRRRAICRNSGLGGSLGPAIRLVQIWSKEGAKVLPKLRKMKDLAVSRGSLVEFVFKINHRRGAGGLPFFTTW